MSDDKKSDDKKPSAPAPKDSLTRVPVKHLHFADNLDLPGGTNQVSNVKCYAETEHSAKYYTAEFIPAWQQFEITLHRFGAPPEVCMMPVAHVRRWERA